jgi:hypothetical protein
MSEVINKEEQDCEWCGETTTKPLQRSYAQDKCCVNCIDDANERTKFFENWGDIGRMGRIDAEEMLNTLIIRYDVSFDELNDIYFENQRNR